MKSTIFLRTLFRPLFFTALATFSCSLSVAAPAPKKAESLAQKDFIHSCLESFTKSQKNKPQDKAQAQAQIQAQNGKNPSASAFNREICECTAKESKSQGASDRALKEAGAKIKEDPSYQIKDPNVMNAFRVCTIEALNKED